MLAFLTKILYLCGTIKKIKNMTKEEINNYLKELEQELCSENNRKSVEMTREWAKKFPDAEGVYLVWENGKICYVGETGYIRGRMYDLLNTRHHTIRRTVGNERYKDRPDFNKATSYDRFSDEIEAELNQWMEKNLEISTLEVKLGRKELEEHLFEKCDPKYNNRGKRKSKTNKNKKEILTQIQKENFLSVSGMEFGSGELRENSLDFLRKGKVLTSSGKEFVSGDFAGCFKTSYPNKGNDFSPWVFTYVIEEETGNLICELVHRMTNNRIFGWDKLGNKLPNEILHKYFTPHF